MIPLSWLPLLAAAPAPQPADAPFDQPFSIVQGEEDTDGWDGSVTAGMILTTGNSETKNATISAEAKWKQDVDRVTLSALWNYQGDETGVIQRRVFGQAQYDHFLSDDTYAYAMANGNHDFNAALDLRWTAGAGLGHQFRADEEWNVNGEAGLSYIDEDYAPTTDDPSGRGSDNEYVAARLAYNLDYLASEKWEFGHGGQIFPSLEDGDDIYARWDTRLKVNLTEAMFAQLQWIWDYDNTPAAGKDRNDHLIAATIGWSF